MAGHRARLVSSGTLPEFPIEPCLGLRGASSSPPQLIESKCTCCLSLQQPAY